MTSEVRRVMVIVNDQPYGSERPHTALRVADALAKRDEVELRAGPTCRYRIGLLCSCPGRCGGARRTKRSLSARRPDLRTRVGTMFPVMRSARVLSIASLVALALAACGGRDAASGPGVSRTAPDAARVPASATAELEHIHGLGVDPGSGALYVATHFGLFRAAKGETKLQRMGASRQDIMGFSVIGPRRFIGSGHPDPSQNLPPDLGLIESRSGGKHWSNISLLGEADFHVLRSSGKRVYGFNGATGKLMVSSDGGHAWTEHTPPAALFDLAISPSDDQRVVASTERGVFLSRNSGKTWRPLRNDVAGLLAWPASGSLFLVDGQGGVSRSTDAGQSFNVVGSIGGPPSAFVGDDTDLYAALGDGTVVRSTDGGTSWAVRATP